MTQSELTDVLEFIRDKETKDLINFLKTIGGEYTFKGRAPRIGLEMFYLDDDIMYFRIPKVEILKDEIKRQGIYPIPAGTLVYWCQDEDGNTSFNWPDRPELGAATAILQAIKLEISEKEKKSKARAVYQHCER